MSLNFDPSTFVKTDFQEEPETENLLQDPVDTQKTFVLGNNILIELFTDKSVKIALENRISGILLSDVYLREKIILFFL